MELYPLRFKPIYKERIWGGRKLKQLYNRQLPLGKKIGESWELVDLKPPDVSEVLAGPLAGKTIHELVKKNTQGLLGETKNYAQFPLLIKILDCQDILSVQVHPDEEACRRIGKGQPKTEAWYILEAEDKAFIYKGLKSGVTRREFSKALREGKIADLLQKVEVKKGECHFIPAGTLHALGAGILVAEIQTPSDTTYRVFDWNRIDQNRRPRELHIEEALESINFEPSDLPVTSGLQLVESIFFKIKKIKLTASSKLYLKKGQLKLVIITEGEMILKNTYQDSSLKAGDLVLIPWISETELVPVPPKFGEALIVTL